MSPSSSSKRLGPSDQSLIMNTAIIGLGSNIDPADNIEKAKTLLQEQFTVLGLSEFTQTKPVGNTHQADFINGAILIETAQTLPQLKATLKGIEQKLGRPQHHPKSAPRTIDLDILVFNDQITDPDFYSRGFIKKSVLDLKPDLKY